MQSSMMFPDRPSERPRRFCRLQLAKTHPVFFEKLDAGASENTFDRCQRILVSQVAADLDAADARKEDLPKLEFRRDDRHAAELVAFRFHCDRSKQFVSQALSEQNYKFPMIISDAALAAAGRRGPWVSEPRMVVAAWSYAVSGLYPSSKRPAYNRFFDVHCRPHQTAALPSPLKPRPTQTYRKPSVFIVLIG